MMQCPGCGAQNIDEATFCDHCGKALSPLAGTPYRVYRYDVETARRHTAFASKWTMLVRILGNIGLPIVILVIFWDRFYAKGIGVIALLILGLLAFTGRDLWRRRHLLTARRSAVVWDSPQDRLYYVTLADESLAQQTEAILNVLKTGQGGTVRDLKDRRVKYRSFSATGYTYLEFEKRAKTFDIPHAFPGFEEVDQ